MTRPSSDFKSIGKNALVTVATPKTFVSYVSRKSCNVVSAGFFLIPGNPRIVDQHIQPAGLATHPRCRVETVTGSVTSS